MDWVAELEAKGILLPHEWKSGVMGAADRKAFYQKAMSWPKTRIAMHNKQTSSPRCPRTTCLLLASGRGHCTTTATAG